MLRTRVALNQLGLFLDSPKDNKDSFAAATEDFPAIV